MQDFNQILDTINQFYSNAYNQLVLYTVGLLAFLGAAVPALLAFLSNRSIKKEGEKQRLLAKDEIQEIERKLFSRIDEAIAEKEKDLQDRMQAGLSQTKKELEQLSNSMQGGLYHLQSSQAEDQKIYTLALESAALSAGFYIKGGDEYNFQHVVHLCMSILQKMNRVHFERRPQVETRFKEMLSAIEEINQRGRYSDQRSDLSAEFKKAKDREPPAAA